MYAIGVIKTVGHLRDFMECGGKRSATPLWLESRVLRSIQHKQPKRRRASLAAALHMAVAVILIAPYQSFTVSYQARSTA